MLQCFLRRDEEKWLYKRGGAARLHEVGSGGNAKNAGNGSGERSILRADSFCAAEELALRENRRLQASTAKVAATANAKTKIFCRRAFPSIGRVCTNLKPLNEADRNARALN